MSYYEKYLHLGVILNCILVNENVRPAMLVQPADYNEATHNDPKTKSIIDEIKGYFPDLLISTDYQIYQGAIVSKTDYNGKTDVSLNEMGKILGYPCYEDFEKNNDDDITYSIIVTVQDTKNNKIEIIVNICNDETNIEKFNQLATDAKNALINEKYKKILDDFNFKVKNVYVESSPIIPTQILINKLIKNEELNENEKGKITNILFNYGFSFEIEFYFVDHFQYDNPVHKGILLGLLLSEKDNMLSPFYPLQNYPKQSEEIYKITEKLEKDLLDTLVKTEKIGYRQKTMAKPPKSQNHAKTRKSRKPKSRSRKYKK